MFTLAGTPPDPARRKAAAATVRKALDLCDRALPGEDDPSPAAAAAWIMALGDEIQAAAGLPVFETGRVLAADAQSVRLMAVSLPRALEPLMGFIDALLDLAAGRTRADLARIFAALRAGGYTATNTPRFVRAAHDLGLPFQELPGRFLQYGEGAHRCWLDSTFTEKTPFIGIQLAKDKLQCGALLRRAGLPAPPQQPVGSPADAVRAARAIGFPVVVKPANLDGGEGVFAGLFDAAEVEAAFARAATLSKRVLVEKHVDGADYRLTVMDGAVIWAVERVPAGVTGDGVSTVDQLVTAANGDPKRSDDPHSPLKPIVLDAEADRLLARAALSRSSVPDAGRFVRLKQAANVATGGTPVGAFDRLHPDNAALAVRAARLLGLDLAGVDLLIPDLGRSWRESGAAICEVNGQPQLGATTSLHVYPQILRRLTTKSGRIASALIVGAPDLARKTAAALKAGGLVCGWRDEAGVFVDGEALVDGPVSAFGAGQMLILDSRVQAMVLGLGASDTLANGLPVPRLDLVVAAGPAGDILGRIAPACDGQIVLGETSGVSPEGLKDLTSASIMQVGALSAAELAGLLLSADAARA